MGLRLHLQHVSIQEALLEAQGLRGAAQIQTLGEHAILERLESESVGFFPLASLKLWLDQVIKFLNGKLLGSSNLNDDAVGDP